jgi:hypothetical protein
MHRINNHHFGALIEINKRLVDSKFKFSIKFFLVFVQYF